MRDDLLVVISHYASRDTLQLRKLLIDLTPLVESMLVVVNSNDVTDEFKGIFEGCPAIFRPNTGMNIGGWNAAYQNYPNYKYYIFLQDECSLLRGDFIIAYIQELNVKGVGMTGESINFKWDRSWAEIFHSPLNYLTETFLDGRRISRVENYLRIIKHWGINPGEGGRHLRSLVWGFNQNALKKIGGFPEGRSKEECIASEIAVSKKIEELGFRVTQISEVPFSFFKHQEWRLDGHSKI